MLCQGLAFGDARLGTAWISMIGKRGGTVEREGLAATPTGPIGACLAARTAHGPTAPLTAANADGSAARLADLETGRDWVDRQTTLVALMAATGLGLGELTGQPYPPAGAEHASVRSAAFQLRRVVAESTRLADASNLDLPGCVGRVTAAEAAGDELELARAAPEAIRQADAALAVAGADREHVRELRSCAHAAAAGLLRRLGYWDLAWSLLHRASASQLSVVHLEEARLLLDLGMPEYALARAERAPVPTAELAAVTALAHAVAGKTERAAQVLDEASCRAEHGATRAIVDAARVQVAVETAAWDEAVTRAREVDEGALTPANRVPLLIALAAAHARRGDSAQAASHLKTAETTAPWLVRLNPYARELLVVLPTRAADPNTARVLDGLAARAGLR